MDTSQRNIQIEKDIRKQALDLNIKRVLVALSGGADSIATAFLLKKINLDISALHCNFHLRGEESNRDTDFVTEFCDSYDIPIKIKNFNVSHYIQHHKGLSVEMACRELRHKWFEEELTLCSFDRIATGHNADDNIETFLLNCLRGSGTRGLRAMDVDNGKIWRPLLKLPKSDIIVLLNDYNVSYVVDSTNLSTDYRRNYLRNIIIPLLKKEWKGFDSALNRTIKNLESENKIVEYSINKILSRSHNCLTVKEIIEFPAPLLLIKRFIEILGPYVKTPEEIFAAIKANKPHIRSWNLRNGKVLLQNGRLFIKMGHSE